MSVDIKKAALKESIFSPIQPILEGENFPTLLEEERALFENFFLNIDKAKEEYLNIASKLTKVLDKIDLLSPNGVNKESLITIISQAILYIEDEDNNDIYSDYIYNKFSYFFVQDKKVLLTALQSLKEEVDSSENIGKFKISKEHICDSLYKIKKYVNLAQGYQSVNSYLLKNNSEDYFAKISQCGFSDNNVEKHQEIVDKTTLAIPKRIHKILFEKDFQINIDQDELDAIVSKIENYYANNTIISAHMDFIKSNIKGLKRALTDSNLNSIVLYCELIQKHLKFIQGALYSIQQRKLVLNNDFHCIENSET